MLNAAPDWLAMAWCIAGGGLVLVNQTLSLVAQRMMPRKRWKLFNRALSNPILRAGNVEIAKLRRQIEKSMESTKGVGGQQKKQDLRPWKQMNVGGEIMQSPTRPLKVNAVIRL